MAWTVPVRVPTPPPGELRRALSLLRGTTPPPSLGLGTIASIASIAEAMSRQPSPVLPPARALPTSLYDALVAPQESAWAQVVRSLASYAPPPRPPQESALALFARSLLDTPPPRRTLADSVLPLDVLRFLNETGRWP